MAVAAHISRMFTHLYLYRKDIAKLSQCYTVERNLVHYQRIVQLNSRRVLGGNVDYGLGWVSCVKVSEMSQSPCPMH